MNRIRAFLDHYVDPSDRLAQILFGLIMLLTTTYAAGRDYDENDHKETVTLIKDAVGCNVAWGVITGVLYTMYNLYDRSRPIRLQYDFRGAADDAEALALIQDEIDEDFTDITTPEQRQELSARILENLRKSEMSPPRVQPKDFVAGLVVFVIVSLTVVALAPFCFLSDLRLAITVTNWLIFGLMFVVGFCWGRVVHMNPWKTGLGILVIGVAMVGVAEYLGG